MVDRPRNVNRRKEPRFRVAWPATLTCHLAGQVASVETRVTEVSSNGARLQMESLEVGSNHIVVASESIRFTLKVNRPTAAFCAPVSIAWYSSGREKDSFDVGVMFLQNPAERTAAIEKLLADDALDPAHGKC